jgi:hypothetical protein
LICLQMDWTDLPIYEFTVPGSYCTVGMCADRLSYYLDKNLTRNCGGLNKAVHIEPHGTTEGFA